MLIFILIVTAELIVLFRLFLPSFLAFAEARHHEVYDLAHGDWPHVPAIKNPYFHDRSDTL